MTGLTAAKLRYLLTVAELSSPFGGGGPRRVRCIDVAVRLGVARPSACRMLESLCREGLLSRSREEGVRLSPAGESALGERLSRYRKLACCFRSHAGLSEFDASEAAMALVTSAPERTAKALAEKLP